MPSGPRLNIPPELALLMTPNTFILFIEMDLLPTSTQAPTVLTSAFLHHGWAVSLISQHGTGDFLAGLATALKDWYSALLHDFFFL
jgi:hypothetical protein